VTGSRPELPPADGPALIVAVGRDGAIGRDGGLPWRAPEDGAHFRRTTDGHALVLGAATWTSIGRPLPGRRIVVASRRDLGLPDGVRQAPDADAALDVALGLDPAPFIGGGAQVYAALLPRTRRVYLTEIDEDVVGADTFFPSLDPADWIEVAAWTGDDARLTFRVLDRQPGR
jgi:dihydrofolate reductase